MALTSGVTRTSTLLLTCPPHSTLCFEASLAGRRIWPGDEDVEDGLGMREEDPGAMVPPGVQIHAYLIPEFAVISTLAYPTGSGTSLASLGAGFSGAGAARAERVREALQLSYA